MERYEVILVVHMRWEGKTWDRESKEKSKEKKIKFENTAFK